MPVYVISSMIGCSFDCYSHIVDNWSWRRDRSVLIIEHILSTGVVRQSCGVVATVYQNVLCPNILSYLQKLYELPPPPASVSVMHYCALLYHTIQQEVIQRFIRTSGVGPKQLIGSGNFSAASMGRTHAPPALINSLLVGIYNNCLGMEARCQFLVTLVNRVCANCNHGSDGCNTTAAGVGSSNSSSGGACPATSDAIRHSQWQLRRLMCSDLRIMSLLMWYLPLITVKLKTEVMWCMCSLTKLTPQSAL
jgi:hypothetical protein